MKVSMQLEERTFLKRIDLNFVLVIFALNLVGLINLYSATHGVHSVGLSRLFLAQIFWLVIGWGLFFLLTIGEYHFFSRFAYVFYGLNLVALVVVMYKGSTYYGAQRWIDFGIFRFQPSETMKIALILVLAKIIAPKSRPNGLELKDLILPGIFTLIPFGLVVKQPDLGTAMLLAAISVTMIMFVGVKKKILIWAVVSTTIAVPLVYNFGLKEYQKDRIKTFVDPGKDPRGSGYNSIQSRIAVGSGQILGKGFRKGTQSQLEFLPERHTDFIFSVLSEEHGFVGSITTVSLFITLFLLAIRNASQARDKFGCLMVVGIIAFMFWHFFINVGMVIGVMPIVGVPLPLLSYGGSSMLATMSALGLISAVHFRKFLF